VFIHTAAVTDFAITTAPRGLLLNEVATPNVTNVLAEYT
jgi:hypothetical protein